MQNIKKAELDHLVGKGVIQYGDLLDVSSLEKMIRTIKPHEIYNIAAQSHVRISMEIPQFTVQTNTLGLLNILEAYKNNYPKLVFIKFLHRRCLDALLIVMAFREKLQK